MFSLIEKIRQCNSCKNFLPEGPRPVVQLSPQSKVLIIGQAPGKRVHQTGIPWNDASGRTLRKWLNVDEFTFYNPDVFSIMPMGFCYPGKGKSGDLAPRRECAPLWHSEILSQFETEPLVLLVGQYAQAYYLKKDFQGSLTETVRNYEQFIPSYFPLPHPSPRNQNWLKVNPWFGENVIPVLQALIEARVRQMDCSSTRDGGVR